MGDDYMMYSWICLPMFILIVLALSGKELRIIKKSQRYSAFVAYCVDISYCFSGINFSFGQ